ncbi:MAG TPA: hypothetical protein VM695_00170 [Phycisphaerae bacterium]|nr:hypothetical protein [Phycisphaerae bacterium]
MLSRRTWMIVFLAGVVPAGAPAGAGDDFELGPRYVDPVNGFSLRPPAGAERSREFSLNRLVRWSVRDKRSGAIAWTLTVRKEPAPPAGTDVKAYLKKLLDGFKGRADIRVDSARPMELLGKEGFSLRTERGGEHRRWQAEVWVLADADRFLAISVNGALGAKDELDSALREVASTLRLTDPKSLAAARQEGLQRGTALLKGLSAQKLSAAAAAGPRWYLYQRTGRDVGFLYLVEEVGARGSERGVTVRTFARLELKDGQVLHLRREMFAPADRASEQWSETAVVWQGGKAVRRMSEEGAKRGAAITCKVDAGGKSTTRQKPVPAATDACYLPRAMAPLLPRLVDLAKPAAYAFATYTTAADDFDMRTFTVIGPEKITLGAKTMEAVRASDQVAADAEAAALHLAPDGTLLRMRTDMGIVMEQATPGAVLRRFPDAEALVRGR